jgi:hypothetical protein
MNQIKVSHYLKVNIPYIVRNWKDEFFRLNYDNDSKKYKKSITKRLEKNIFERYYISLDIQLDQAIKTINSLKLKP